ncbi:MAG TPA: dienelactone hydrolase family protein, partial [Dehalococcoidia bacterium]|nr:dienelactone hydrolase family protein [Dehalococcoidia bacterium]
MAVLRLLNAHRLLVLVAVVMASFVLGIACGAANDRGGTAEPAVPIAATAASAVAAAQASAFAVASPIAPSRSPAPANAPNVGASPPPARANGAGAARRGAAGRGAQPASCSAVSYESNGAPVSAYLCLPDGAGPWPAVIVLHGAEGPKINPGYRLIAQGLADAGFAALQVDYFSQTRGSGPSGNPVAADYARDAPVWLREIGDGVSYL